MKDIPDIIKELRNEERQGILTTLSDSIYEIEVNQTPQNEVTKEKIEDHSGKIEEIDLGSIEEKYRILFENFAVGITLVDEKERIVSWNKYAEELFNMDEQHLHLMHVSKLYPEEEWKKIRKQDIRKKGMEFKLETKMIRNGEKPFDAEISLCILRGEKGKVTGSIGIIRDISRLKTTERRLIESEEKYRTIFDNSAVAIMLTDENEKIISWNKYAETLLDMQKKDIYNKPVKSFYPSNEWTKIRSHNIRQKGMQHHLETKMIKKDSSLIDVDISISVLKNHEGNIIGSIGVIRDISERKQAEKGLVESEKKFKEIFNATGDFLLVFDVNGMILDINIAALGIVNIKKEKLIGKDLSILKNLFSDQILKRHIQSINDTVNGEETRECECELLTKDDITFRFLFSTDVIKENNNITGVLFRGRDITQRQRAWEELVKLEEKYRVLAETSADGVITIDSLGRLTYINPSFEAICGRRKSQILATLLRDYLSDESIYLFQQIFIDARKKDEKSENIELELVHLDGETVPVEVNIAPLKKDKKFIGVICTIRDITGRKKVEEELKKSERLKTEFMNIAAHELKSPVTPIKGYLDLIISDKDSSKKVVDWAKISLRNSERLLRLVNDILDVSRLDSDTMRFNMEKLNSVEILEELVEDMEPAIKQKGLEFIIHIPRNLPSVMGDKYRLAQVFKNLLVNAIKFTDNGSIALVVKEEDNHILISVEDSGIGISKEELKKVFSKFYQAYTGDDRRNEGTGLGLFICQQIIDKHNGKIWAESNIPHGSTFRIKIPAL